MGDGVHGQLCPVLQGGSRLKPRVGEAAARVPSQEDSVVQGGSMEGGSLYGGG